MNIWRVKEFINHRQDWNTVGLTPIQIKNESITVPLSGVLFSFANGAYEFSVKFCVVKFSSFG